MPQPANPSQDCLRQDILPSDGAARQKVVRVLLVDACRRAGSTILSCAGSDGVRCNAFPRSAVFEAGTACLADAVAGEVDAGGTRHLLLAGGHVSHHHPRHVKVNRLTATLLITIIVTSCRCCRDEAILNRNCECELRRRRRRRRRT